MPIPFQGGLIRPFLPSDAEALSLLAGNREVWLNLRNDFPHPYTRKHARAWIRAATRQFPCMHFAICAGPAAEFAGGIGINLRHDVHQGTAEIGYWLGEPFWGRGLMTSALAAFTGNAFAEFRLRRIFAGVFEWNPASARVLEKCGYAFEGRMRKAVVKDGKVCDELVYAKVV
jgi:RimJ/RimL family protein N-acetyltransferase